MNWEKKEVCFSIWLEQGMKICKLDTMIKYSLEIHVNDKNSLTPLTRNSFTCKFTTILSFSYKNNIPRAFSETQMIIITIIMCFLLGLLKIYQTLK